MTLSRYLESAIAEDLREKMVFVAGPRQVGKTTLAREILRTSGPGVYFNWDSREDRREIQSARWPGGEALIVLDELHKWRPWKGWIKGEYDKHWPRIRFLVTGSARMDVYRRGSDSLQGRYHHYRLHPLSLAEIAGPTGMRLPQPGEELPVPAKGDQETLDLLMTYGGFPEPFLARSGRGLRRWQKERIERFFREDVRDLEPVRDFSAMQTLADLLPEKVGAPLSLNALREDLEVSHRAVTHWIEILERLYYVFRIPPYASSTIRTLRKMPKAYLWDASVVAAEAARFENLLAGHLLKFCHYLEDREGFRLRLHYLRDRTGKEVDFLVTSDGKPWFAVEGKLSDPDTAPALHYYRGRLRIPWTYQVVLHGRRDYVERGVRCLPANRFLAALV